MSSSRRSTIIVEHLRKQQMREAISNSKRLDGRDLDEMRPLEIELGVIGKADGSSRVRLGNSEVVAGVKAGLPLVRATTYFDQLAKRFGGTL